MSSKAQGKESVSLLDFATAKRRANCKVCKLPEEIKAQIALARDKKIPRPVVVEWLNNEMKLPITNADLDLHRNGQHERRQ